jgi:hypothetical protein
MRQRIRSLAAPSIIVAVLGFVAVVGIGFQLLGIVTQSAHLRILGFLLLFPYLIAGVLIIVLVIPLLLWKQNERLRNENRRLCAIVENAEDYQSRSPANEC